MVGPTTIARWAAGADLELPEPREVSGDVLDETIELLAAHRLLGRFLARVRMDEHDFPEPLLSEAKRRHVTQMAQLEADMRSVREIIVAAEETSSVVLLKGSMAAGVTQLEAALRPGRDIDIAADNAESVDRIIRQLGYVTAPEKPEPSPHEYGNYARGETRIDLHKSFPVWSIEDTLNTEALLPPTSQAWVQDFGDRRSAFVPSEVIIRNSVIVQQGPLVGIRVPIPELQVVLLAAHVFEDCITHVVAKRFGTMKLAELADMISLVQCPGFNVTRYAEISRAFDAHDAMRFARLLIAELIGIGDFPCSCADPSCEPAKKLPPRRFMRGLWLSSGCDVADVVSRQVEFDGIIRPLRPNSFPGTGRQSLSWAPSDNHGALRVIVKAWKGRVVPLALDINLTAEYADMTVTASAPSDDFRRCRMIIVTSHGKIETTYDLLDGRITQGQDPLRTHVVAGGDTCTYSCRVAMPAGITSRAAIVGVVYQTSTDPAQDMSCGTAFPLIFEPTPID